MISASELHPIRQRRASIAHAALIPRWFPHSNLKLLRSNRAASGFLLAADSIMVSEEQLQVPLQHPFRGDVS
jgi:hypothetical protein